MGRDNLLDEIRVLTSMLKRFEGHELRMEQADELDFHIETQITRLEEAAVKLERRLLELDATDAPYVSDTQMRRDVSSRLERIQTKIRDLRSEAMQNDVLDATAYASRPPSVPSRLRRTLLTLVRDMHDDPTVPRASIRPFQDNLAQLVRGRRDALTEAANRMAASRDYMLNASQRASQLLDMVRMITSTPDDALPYRDDRHAAAQRVSMAETATRDAHQMLLDIAHDWPELTPLANRPDWDKLPFQAMVNLLTPHEDATSGPWVPRFVEIAETTQALALWLEELRSAIANAPPP